MNYTRVAGKLFLASLLALSFNGLYAQFTVVYSSAPDEPVTPVNVDSLTFKGLYADAASEDCKEDPPRRLSGNYEIDARGLFREVDDAFVQAISKEEIIILNEAHRLPQNRAFAHQLLDKLLTPGNHFYVFFEALNPAQRIAGVSGLKAVGQDQGYYFQEPQMAENLRLVLSRNKAAYAYESLDKTMFLDEYYKMDISSPANDAYVAEIISQSGDSRNYTCGMNIRDFNQFINFYRQYRDIRKADPAAQFILIVGFGHIGETLNDDCVGDACWHPLAYNIRKLLNKPLCTIDLTSFVQSCANKINPYYDTILNQLPDKRRYYYTTADLLKTRPVAHPRSLLQQPTKYYIFSPPVQLLNNRESWLRSAGRKPYPLPESILAKAGKGKYIKAVHYGEELSATTPADIIYTDRHNTFLLYPGIYRIADENNKVLIDKAIIDAGR